METWVFMLWFLLQDGTIVSAERGPFTSQAGCSAAQERFRVAPDLPPLSEGYIMTGCRVKA